MRWLTFAVAALLAIALERSAMDVFTLQSLGGIRPSLVPILLVFVALLAPRHTALWVAWILGMLMDLAFPVQEASGAPLYVLGPHALGYVAASYAVILVRPMVFRRRVLTLAILSLGVVLLAGIVVTALLVIRSKYPSVDPPAAHLVGGRRLIMTIGVALYTALIAVPFGWMLYASLPLWSFYHAGPRSSNVR